MRRHNRDVVPVFEGGEQVFFRWYRNDIKEEFRNEDNPTGITPNQIPTPDQSVNRSGLEGRCWFVLIPEAEESVERRNRKLCMGILKLAAGRMPTPTTEGNAVYTFVLEHDPLPENYQHCEIRVYKDGVRQTAVDRKKLKKLIPNKVKLHYRAKMAEFAAWELLPEAGHD